MKTSTVKQESLKPHPHNESAFHRAGRDPKPTGVADNRLLVPLNGGIKSEPYLQDSGCVEGQNSLYQLTSDVARPVDNVSLAESFGVRLPAHQTTAIVGNAVNHVEPITIDKRERIRQILENNTRVVSALKSSSKLTSSGVTSGGARYEKTHNFGGGVIDTNITSKGESLNRDLKSQLRSDFEATRRQSTTQQLQDSAGPYKFTESLTESLNRLQ